MYNGFPYLFVSSSATFLGLMQAAHDGPLAYLSHRMRADPAYRDRGERSCDCEMLFGSKSARAI
jgi:hypothetical protein